MDVHTLISVYNSNEVIVEIYGNYIKQSYRNRTTIAAANGKLSLSIPTLRDANKIKQIISDVKIDYREDWQSNHLKSIKTAYKSSPFYEFYEDDLIAVYDKKPTTLLEWNLLTMRWLLNQLQIHKSFSKTKEFLSDKRADILINAKGKLPFENEPYRQVFQEKHGFINRCSGLDILFNLGPETVCYLKRHHSII